MNTCSECKRPLPHDYSGVTCGAACRQRRSRRQHEQHTCYERTMNELGLIRDAIKRREDVKYQQQVLHRLKHEINDLLALAGDQDELQRRAMLEDLKMRAVGADWK